jgi:hypothetical protein
MHALLLVLGFALAALALGVGIVVLLAYLTEDPGTQEEREQRLNRVS